MAKAKLVYEIHRMKNPGLPFILHDEYVLSKKLVRSNWHENIEILRCTGGKGTVRCGSQVFPIEQGDLFVVNANTPHCLGGAPSVRTRCLIVDNSFCTANMIPIERLLFQHTIRDPELNRLFDRVVSAYDEFDPDSVYGVAEIRCAVLELLCRLCREYVVQLSASDTSVISVHIRRALSYIREHVASRLTLDEIAAHVGVNKFYLSREFREFTGSTMVQTINMIRCIQAQQLMESGASVSEAALTSGFENLSYFSRTFKKCMGILPSRCVNPGEP